MEMLRGLLVLLLAQLAGEVVHRALRLPLPGPVMGMALLAAVLLVRRRAPGAGLVAASGGLLRVLGLLFVPAGVGVVANLGRIRGALVPIAVTLVVSTTLTAGVTAVLMQWMVGRGAAGIEGSKR